MELQASLVINNIDGKAKGLIVQRRYISTGEHPIVIQCRGLKELGIPCEANKNILVSIYAVGKYVQKGITTVIIN